MIHSQMREEGARTKVGGLGGKACRVDTVFDMALGGQKVHPISNNKRQTYPLFTLDSVSRYPPIPALPYHTSSHP